MPGAQAARAQARVVPVSPLRLPGPDALARGDRRRLRRLIHLDGVPVVLTIAAGEDGAVELTADAPTQRAAAMGLARARFWTGVDDDLRPFLEGFADDPLLGRSIREAPWVRPYRRPVPFDVLLGAICEQLITDERAMAIKRSIVRLHGRGDARLPDLPDAAAVAGLAPAQLQRCGLAARRALTLVAAAREVASGRAELMDPARQEEGRRRLRAIPGIGAWTVSSLALHGQGHLDALPAGDHAYMVATARVRGRPPGPKATEEEVRDLLAPYAGWRGVAGWHLLRVARRTA